MVVNLCGDQIYMNFVRFLKYKPTINSNMFYYKCIHCTEDSSEQMMMKSFRSFHYRDLTGVGDRKFFLGCLMLTLLYNVP